MRSAEGSETKADCEDPMIKAACLIDDDSCPAECKESSDEKEDTDTVVKAGDLDVSADGDSNGRLFVGRASELDTITLKTSEEVEITKITLERIGYSAKENIKEVWLEDENGAKIADAKTLDSKGQVKLTIKKDYRNVDGSLAATIVVDTYDEVAEKGDATNNIEPIPGAKELKAGATVGFKVVEVSSSAKNTNISSKANTYTAIAFDASKITFSATPSTKEYNWEAGELYEVAKFKVSAPEESSIILRGFTFENIADTVKDGEGENAKPLYTELDVRKYFDKAEVTIAGEKVSGLEASVNKDDELVVSFKDVEVAAKKKSEIIVKIALTDDFDTFGNTIKYQLKDFVAVDGKVESRVAVNGDYPVMTAYTFKGGKIKIANTKLGNVDAAQNSEDIVIAEGTITLPEAIKGDFCITVIGTTKTDDPTINSRDAIKGMTVSVNGDETDGKYGVTGCADGYKFTNVEFEKSGKIQFLIDIKDYNTWNSMTIDFGTFKAGAFSSLKYDESGRDATEETSGSISFSKVTIQPSKASLKNNITKDVEFANKATRTEIVFDGTYTAKKGDIELNEFLLEQTREEYQATNKVTFYLYVDDMKTAVADADAKYANGKYTATNTFNNIKVKAGESVNVRVEAEVEAENPGDNFTSYSLGKYKLYIRGEDVNGNSNSGKGDANTVSMKVVDKGSVKVSTSTTKQTILRRANDAKIAEFIVKPGNNATSVDLEEISFKLSGGLDSNKITLKVADIEEDDSSTKEGALVYTMNRDVKSDGVVVLITIDDEDYVPAYPETVSLTDLKVNGKNSGKEFTKSFVPAAVEIVKQRTSGSSTIFTLAVDADSDVDVRNFTVYYKNKDKEDASKTIGATKVFDDGDTLSVVGEDAYAAEITSVSYEYSSEATEAKDAVPAKCTVDGVVNPDITTKDACDAANIADDPDTPDDDETVVAEWTPAQAAIEIGDTVWNTITITKNALPDYFKIDDEDIVISKA